MFDVGSSAFLCEGKNTKYTIAARNKEHLFGCFFRSRHRLSFPFRGGHIPFSVARACRAARLRAAAPFLQICNAYGVVAGWARSLATDMDPLTGMFCKLYPKSWKKSDRDVMGFRRSCCRRRNGANLTCCPGGGRRPFPKNQILVPPHSWISWHAPFRETR